MAHKKEISGETVKRLEHAPLMQGLSNLTPLNIPDLLEITFGDDWVIFIEDLKKGNYFLMSAHMADQLSISDQRREQVTASNYSIKFLKEAAARKHALIILSHTVPIAAIVSERLIKDLLGERYKVPKTSVDMGELNLSPQFDRALRRFYFEARMDGREMLAPEIWPDGTLHITISPPERS
ncbi:MAG: hypothetical protein IT558_02080 [Alphaproteobacteria bacterium]|nr:hypothetical protein [Alphaproteobacteria bacterium]